LASTASGTRAGYRLYGWSEAVLGGLVPAPFLLRVTAFFQLHTIASFEVLERGTNQLEADQARIDKPILSNLLEVVVNDVPPEN
jgi:hypothetical protein